MGLSSFPFHLLNIELLLVAGEFPSVAATFLSIAGGFISIAGDFSLLQLGLEHLDSYGLDHP
jgi:hypothetical protein